MALQITWLGHSCYRLEADGYTLILDPFEPGSVPGVSPVSGNADMVLCSHDHYDHNYRQGFTLSDPPKESPFRVTLLSSFHDGEHGALRGKNTIHLLEYQGMRIAHLGDLGCELTQLQQQTLQNLDLLLLPVGGFYTIGPEEAAQVVTQLNPKVTIPMHYRQGEMGFDVLAAPDAFLSHFPRYQQLDTASFTLSKDTAPGIYLLTYQPQK